MDEVIKYATATLLTAISELARTPEEAMDLVDKIAALMKQHIRENNPQEAGDDGEEEQA